MEKISIECSNCGTKYKVAKSRITQKVSKVKCAKCGIVFQIAPPSPTTPQEEAPQSKTSNLSSPPQSPDKAYFEAVAIDDSEPGVVPEISLGDFDPDDIFMEPGALPDKKQVSASNKETASQNSIDDKLMELSEIPPLEEMAIPPELEDELSENLSSAPPQTEQPISSKPSQPIPIVEEAPVERQFGWGKASFILFGIFIVLLGIGSAGTYFTLKEPSLINQLLGIPEHHLPLSEKFTNFRVKNIPSRQTLFIVEGELQNQFPSEDQISWIRFKGIAFDENRDIVETSLAFAGNILGEEELSTWTLEQIKKHYQYSNGRNDSNFEILENQRVPFQIVFFESASVVKSVTAKLISYVRQDETVYVQ